MHDIIFRFNHDLLFAQNCVIVSIFAYMASFLTVGVIATSFEKLCPYRFLIIGVFTLIFGPMLLAEVWLIPEYLLVPIEYSTPTPFDAADAMAKNTANVENLIIAYDIIKEYSR
jgi:hypothetical protein